MRSLKQSTVIIMVFSIITRITSFLFKVYLSRRVGAETLGVFQMSTSVFALLCTVSSSGIPLMLSRRTAWLTAEGRENELHGIMSGACALSLGIALALIVFALLGKNAVARLFSDKRSYHIFYIILPALISTVMYQLFRAYLMGKKRYLQYSVTELIEEVIKICACIITLSNVFVVLSDSIAVAVAFTVTDFTVMFVLFGLYLYGGGRFRKPASVRELMQASTPVTATRILGSLLSSFIAIMLPYGLMKSGFSSAQASAEYGRAVGMAFPLLYAPLSLTSALSIVMLPEAASLAAKDRWDDLRCRVDNSVIFIFIIACTFYFLFVSLGANFGKVIFNDTKAGEFISFAAGMVLPLSLSQLTGTVLNSVGEEKYCFMTFCISAAAMVAILVFLPAVIGIKALAVAETAFYTLQFFLGVPRLIKRKCLSCRIFRPAVITMCATIPAALAAGITNSLLKSLPLAAATAIAAAISCGVYGLLLTVFKPVPNLKAFLLHNPAKPHRDKKAHSGAAYRLTLHMRFKQFLKNGKGCKYNNNVGNKVC